MMGRRDLRQLAQRVTARYHLSPLDRAETEDYVRHRLSVAGGQTAARFAPDALSAIHQSSAGVPRLVNLICDRALLAGYVQGTHTITREMAQQAAQEAMGDRPQRRRLGAALKAAALAAGLLLAGLTGAALARRPSPVAEPVPAVLAAPATAAPATTPPAAASPLAPWLLALERDASRRAAEFEVTALWGGRALERTTLRTHLDQVRRLDLPVVLEMFHPGRTDTCFVALLRLSDGQALLARGPGATLQVSEAELDRLWTRQATFLWRDFDALGTPPDADRAAAWTRSSLGRLGYLADGADLSSAVARFQRDAELSADGVIGERTLMTLYSRGPYARPRLLEGGAS